MPKKDGTWQMCIDYKALNKITLNNRYPLPKIDDFLDQLQQAKYFTKQDLKSGYHQVRVKEEDTWKTAFKTMQGCKVCMSGQKCHLAYWGKGRQEAFEELKKKSNQAPILALPNLQQRFEVETNASGYAMGVVLLQGGKLVCYHSKVFHGEVLNYLAYNKELYAMVQVVKKWKHYLMRKEPVIHTDH
eukprot:PITA_26624